MMTFGVGDLSIPKQDQLTYSKIYVYTIEPDINCLALQLKTTSLI
jgi:hypothetical protein